MNSVNQPRGTWVKIPVQAVEKEIRAARQGWRTEMVRNIQGAADLILTRVDPQTGELRRLVIHGNLVTTDPRHNNTVTLPSPFVYEVFHEAGIRPSEEFRREYPQQSRWVSPNSPFDPQDPAGREDPPNKPLPPEPPDAGGHRGEPGPRVRRSTRRKR